MIHSLHKTRGRVLFDDCASCAFLAQHPEEIDEDGLRYLAEMASIMHFSFDDPSTHGLSANERRAISRLRMYARVVYKSGMAEEVAR